MSGMTNNLPGLPFNVTSRIIVVSDLDMHILEAQPPPSGQIPAPKPPLLVLLHGFPEIAYSWRKVMGPLAASGYAVVAPDQRGFGRTKERDRQSPASRMTTYEDDLSPFRMLNLTTDIVALVYALGYTSVAAVIGHDFGSLVAAYCALIRPDVFRSVVMMSAPFNGPPALSTPATANAKPFIQQVDDMLANLDPPRKHYTMYFSSPQANADTMSPPQGLHTFLRTYYHVKSADWKTNNGARPLGGISPAAVASMPYYYIMPRSQSMPACLAPSAPSAEEIRSNTWLLDDELAVYTSQYTATGFQGGFNWYRCQTDPNRWAKDLQVFAGKQIEVPAMFIGGAQDWGVYQLPGAVEAMRTKACKNMEEEDFVLVEGAGHWVQQEKPEVVVRHLLRFVRKLDVL